MITSIAAILLASIASQPQPVTVARGLTGTIRFEYKGAALCAKPNQTLTSPVVVRLNGEKGAYRLDFIGAVAGTFDLREYLEAVDGPLPADLPALSATIVTQLPPNHGTDVFEADSRGFSFEAHYFTTLWVLGAVWISVPIVIAARRALRRPPVVAPVVTAPAPTLADQLRELVLRAVAGSLSVAEQGRLELLLLTHWRERLSLQSLPIAEAVIRLRADAAAGRLLREVERWLHAAPAPASVPESRLQELLSPYLNVPAIDENTRGAA